MKTRNNERSIKMYAKNNKSKLTPEYLRSQLSYNPDTGEFMWLFPDGGRNLRRQAGFIRKYDGYVQIKIKRCAFLAHRLAWLYTFGAWPDGNLDHIDRNRLNNRISNLRIATSSENSMNRSKKANCSSRFIGVIWDNRARKWQARIKLNGKLHHLGYFIYEEEAAIAYNAAALARDPVFNSLNHV